MGRIRLKDHVIVLSGKDKGRRGAIVKVLDDDTVVVEGVNMVKKHQKPDRARGKAGGIVKVEAPIHLSNLKVIDPASGKAARVGRRILEDGTIVRYAKGSGTVLDKTK